jgi:hypothetical protein
MNTGELQRLKSLYEQDFHAWVEQTAKLLRCLPPVQPSHQWDAVDLE